MLSFAFDDLEKAFDCVPQKVLRWPLGSLGVDEWVVSISSKACSPMSRVSASALPVEEFGVGVGVHQVSALRSLFFILVLEMLSLAFHTGVPWELFFCWWPSVHRGHTLGLYIHTQGMKSWHGKKRSLCQHEEDQIPGLWRWPRCPEDMRPVPLCCLSQWCRQQYKLWVHKCCSGFKLTVNRPKPRLPQVQRQGSAHHRAVTRGDVYCTMLGVATFCYGVVWPPCRVWILPFLITGHL